MNLNKLLIETLNDATGLPVAQDEYEGKEDKYIVFTYIDERPEVFADNVAVADVAYMQIQLITPKSYNYFAKKETIREALEGAGFSVTSLKSYLGDAFNGTEKIRQTIIEALYSDSR